MKKITGIGANVYDTLVMLPNYPTEDTKLKADGVTSVGGGPTATGLVAAAKLGKEQDLTVEFIGSVAGDDRGKFLLDDFAKWGVSTDKVTVEPGCESFCSFVLLSAEAKTRTCVFHRGNKPPLVLSDAQKASVAESDILMVDGNELDAAVEGAKTIRAAGGNVLYDAGGLYPNVDRLLPYANILIPSEEFALKMTGAATAEEAAQKLYDTYHPELVALTQGVRGGILLDEKGMRRYESYPVEVKDSNGCGDTFHGAFVAAKIHGLDNDAACKYASAAAAVKCTRLGARYAMATDAECRAFLKERGVEL